MLRDIKSYFKTRFNKPHKHTNKNKVKSVKILKISTFCIDWSSNIALNNIKKYKENSADKET